MNEPQDNQEEKLERREKLDRKRREKAQNKNDGSKPKERYKRKNHDYEDYLYSHEELDEWYEE